MILVREWTSTRSESGPSLNGEGCCHFFVDRVSCRHNDQNPNFAESEREAENDVLEGGSHAHVCIPDYRPKIGMIS